CLASGVARGRVKGMYPRRKFCVSVFKYVRSFKNQAALYNSISPKKKFWLRRCALLLFKNVYVLFVMLDTLCVCLVLITQYIFLNFLFNVISIMSLHFCPIIVKQ